MNLTSLRRLLSIFGGYGLSLGAWFVSILGVFWLFLELLGFFYSAWAEQIAKWQGGFGLVVLILISSILAFLVTPRNRISLSASDSGITKASEDCGNKAINLQEKRLMVSSAFGSYFAGLLEAENIHTILPEQVQCNIPNAPSELGRLEQVLWSVAQPRGARLLIIGADGGMGKSTLAAKITRCLYERQQVELILGDSAKNRLIDPVTGKVNIRIPEIYDTETCIKKICAQVGVPYPRGRNAQARAVTAISDKLVDRKVLIIIDNLETVSDMNGLVATVRTLLSRDIRCLITTRHIEGLDIRSGEDISLQLQPLHEEMSVVKFLQWHIRQYQSVHQELTRLEDGLTDRKNIQQLLEKSGGVPLLIQLLASEIAQYSWQRLAHVPNRFSNELLDYLYQQRWDELGSMGQAGLIARGILFFVAQQQQLGKRVTYDRLNAQVRSEWHQSDMGDALKQLYQRFLIVNQDTKEGSFVIFPTLAQFVERVMANSNGI